MPLKVHRKEKESSQSLVRRFSKRIRQSGILRRARRSRFRERPKSGQLKKRSALRREILKKEYKRKRKMGQL